MTAYMFLHFSWTFLADSMVIIGDCIFYMKKMYNFLLIIPKQNVIINHTKALTYIIGNSTNS